MGNVAMTDSRPKNPSGRRIGRPRTRHEPLKAVSTRCPSTMYVYLKGITPFQYSSLTEMFLDMLTRFMAERPWEHGLHWRKPRTAISYAGSSAGSTGWEQVNILLAPENADQVKAAALEAGVSVAAFCYTAIFWWVTYVNPPQKVGLLPKK